MDRRRTLPSREKWRAAADSAGRCLRCGCWPDQRLPPGSVYDSNFRWHTTIRERGYREMLTLCPTCAGRVPVALLLGDPGWMTLRRHWPTRGRRVPAVVPVAAAEEVVVGPAVRAAMERLPCGNRRIPHDRY